MPTISPTGPYELRESATFGFGQRLDTSPYEAAAWSVLSARRPARQMAAVRQRLSEAHGTRFELAGEACWSFPTPERVLAVADFPGVPADKLARLHAVARAAAGGRLDVARLTALDPEGAMAQLRELPGIGPFYASLIVLRACGLADVLVVNEATALDNIARLYGLPGPPGPAEVAELAQAWRPFRTWAAVLLRAATARLPA